MSFLMGKRWKKDARSFCVLLGVLLINVMMFKLLFWLEGWLIQRTTLDIQNG